ncbi:MAG: PAS domain-containing protein [Stellaceae bacterium]
MQTDGNLDLDTGQWHPRSTRLYRHWLAIRPQRGVLPGRQHFDPVAVPDLLPGICLLDVARAPFRLRYRLCGTGVVEAIGREVTGMWLDEAHPAAMASADYVARYRDVVERGAASWRKGPPRLWRHRDFGTVENLLLPLARDGRSVDMLCAHSVLYRPNGTVAF